MRFMSATAAPLFIIITTLLLNFAQVTFGYCIYNKMEDGSAIYIRQNGGYGGNDLSRFTRERLNAGENACCPYTEKDCSRKPYRDFHVKFWMSHIQANTRRHDTTGYEITCPAGGFIIFSGTWDNRRFEVFNADKQPVNFYLEHAYRNSAHYAAMRKTRKMMEEGADKKKNNKAHHGDDQEEEPMVRKITNPKEIEALKKEIMEEEKEVKDEEKKSEKPKDNKKETEDDNNGDDEELVL